MSVCHITTDLDHFRSGDVATFLGKAKAIQTVTSRQARLIFALDATASREPTWEHARALHSALFNAASTPTPLAVQLCHYQGLGHFQHSHWLTQPAALLDQLSNVTCLAGTTQIHRVLKHALQSGTTSHPVRAIVFVGDACEEEPEALYELAGQCAIKTIPIFVFHEGQDPAAKTVFRQLAHISRGAYAPFDVNCADELRALLGAVSRFAVGGVRALRASNSEKDQLFLAQLPNKP